MAHSSNTPPLRLGLTALMVLCLSSLANAQVSEIICPNPTTGRIDERIRFGGTIAPSNLDDIGFNDRDAGGQRIAEDFSFTVPVIVNRIQFLGGYFPTNTPKADSFVLTIYNDKMGLPDRLSIVARMSLGNVSRTDTGTDALGIGLYTYTASFVGVCLSGSTRYWLTIVNNTTQDSDDDWVWAGKHGVGRFARSFDGGMTWLDTSVGKFSFLLSGIMSEPPSVGASISGVSPRIVICQNVTTGQRVEIQDRGDSWDCEAAGLIVNSGNTIRQTVTGIAD